MRLLLILTLSGCATVDRTLTKYENWPHNLMPKSVRSEAPFDPYALGLSGHPVLNTYSISSPNAENFESHPWE